MVFGVLFCVFVFKVSGVSAQAEFEHPGLEMRMHPARRCPISSDIL